MPASASAWSYLEESELPNESRLSGRRPAGLAHNTCTIPRSLASRTTTQAARAGPLQALVRPHAQRPGHHGTWRSHRSLDACTTTRVPEGDSTGSETGIE